MIVKCKNCGMRLEAVAGLEPRLPCPACGCRQRTVEADAANELRFRQQISARVRDPSRTGRHQDRLDVTAGDDLHRKSGKWYQLDRRIDRKNDLYREVVTDPKTGDVIHRCEEPLSEHRGHGSAKQDSDKDEQEE